MDQNLGRVVADLRRHGGLENTLFLFLSDNGASAEWDGIACSGAASVSSGVSTEPIGRMTTRRSS
jgi:arylsulfatase A-like enzyme